MANELTLDDFAQRHTEWVKLAQYIGCPAHLAEDLVQDFYIKLHAIQQKEGSLQRLEYNGQINHGYIYIALRNAWTEINRKPRPMSLNEEIYGGFEEPNDLERQYVYLHKAINQELSKMHWYDRKLFMLYIEEEHSIRSLAAATKISARSIQTTIKNVKDRLKEKCQKEHDFYKEEKSKA